MAALPFLYSCKMAGMAATLCCRKTPLCALAQHRHGTVVLVVAVTQQFSYHTYKRLFRQKACICAFNTLLPLKHYSVRPQDNSCLCLIMHFRMRALPHHTHTLPPSHYFGTGKRGHGQQWRKSFTAADIEVSLEDRHPLYPLLYACMASVCPSVLMPMLLPL